MTQRRAEDGALLMTYGSPASVGRADVRDYLTRVRGGREPDPELVDEFTRRYEVIGGSPLIDITKAQADALATRLGWPVAIGMRFSEPSIQSGLADLSARGVTRVAAIVLSPQYSPLLMGGYRRSIDAGCEALGTGAPLVLSAGPWHDEPTFIEALAGRIRSALANDPTGDSEPVPVLLTAHSLPLRVAEQEPDFLDQLRATAEAVAELAGLARERWQFCWQSAGHEPGEWMTPDFADLMPGLAAGGHRSVLVASVQFLADHLEVLYDIEIGAREQAEREGLQFGRVPSLNADALLIEALASVAERTMSLDPAPATSGPTR